MWAARPARPRCRVPAWRYIPHALLTSFCAVFPVDNPRYLVFVLLDEPHGTKDTGGFALAGYTAAPLAGRVIARIAPLLGVPNQAPPAILARWKFIMEPQSSTNVAGKEDNTPWWRQGI